MLVLIYSSAVSACRNLDFPIDCPVCKLRQPSDDADEPAEVQLQTLVSSGRSLSAFAGGQPGIEAMHPEHAMQLHVSHSTPSLEAIAMPDDPAAGLGMEAGKSWRETPDLGSPAFRLWEGAKQPSDFIVGPTGLGTLPSPSIQITARSAQHGAAHMGGLTKPNESDHAPVQSEAFSPSFPIIAAGTPITPNLVPTDEVLSHQGSRLFSPHEVTHGPPTGATQAATSSILCHAGVVASHAVAGSALEGTDTRTEEESQTDRTLGTFS